MTIIIVIKELRVKVFSYFWAQETEILLKYSFFKYFYCGTTYSSESLAGHVSFVGGESKKRGKIEEDGSPYWGAGEKKALAFALACHS